MANKHTKAQCEFIVRKLAAFEPPRAIAADFCAVFSGVKCDENDVKRLDPAAGAVLPPELHVLFFQTRERVMLDPAAAPFANQQARMIALSAHAAFYSGNNQLSEMRAVLRQIAEEQGAIGNKAGKAAAAPGDVKAPVTEIVRRVVDPKPPEPAAAVPA